LSWPQLERLRLLLAGNRNGLLKARFRLRLGARDRGPRTLGSRPLQRQFPLEAVELGCRLSIFAGGRDPYAGGDKLKALLHMPGFSAHLGEEAEEKRPHPGSSILPKPSARRERKVLPLFDAPLLDQDEATEQQGQVLIVSKTMLLCYGANSSLSAR
jgi:hypothetical protein